MAEYTGILSTSFMYKGRLCFGADLEGVFDTYQINEMLIGLKGQKVRICIEGMP